MQLKQELNTNYTLKKLDLISLTGWEIDLMPSMLRIEIYEDIYSPYLLAQIDLYETESIVEMLPITGNEYVECELELHGIHKKTKGKFIKFKLDVSKVETEQRGENKQIALTLQLISQTFKKNSGKRNRMYHIGKQHEIVETLCAEQLGVELIRSDPCEFEEEYIFPNWHPIGCINFLARNSVSSEYGDPQYVFYEDLKGFHFVSMSYMVDKDFDQIYPTEGVRFRSTMPVTFTPEKAGDPTRDYNVEDYHKKYAFDIVTNTHNGMYGMTMVYHDIANRKWREETDTYETTFDNFMHNAPIPLHEFILKSHEKNRMMYVPMNGIKNPGVYQDEFFVNQRKNLVIRQLQLEQNTMILEINGEPEMRVGFPLDFEMKSPAGFSGSEEEHEKLSGFFLVTKIRHVFEREFYRQFVEMSKDTFFK